MCSCIGSNCNSSPKSDLPHSAYAAYWAKARSTSTTIACGNATALVYSVHGSIWMSERQNYIHQATESTPPLVGATTMNQWGGEYVRFDNGMTVSIRLHSPFPSMETLSSLYSLCKLFPVPPSPNLERSCKGCLQRATDTDKYQYHVATERSATALPILHMALVSPCLQKLCMQ